MPKTNTPSYDQDQFDKAFIRAIAELQTIGFAKNIAAIEKHLVIPKKTLYEVLKGRRGVPRLHRYNVQRFLTETYGINPKIFTNVVSEIWKEGPPSRDEVIEPFSLDVEQPANVMTMGDVLELQRLRQETADQKRRIKDLEKDLSFWRDMAIKLSKSAGKEVNIPDTKPDKKATNKGR